MYSYSKKLTAQLLLCSLLLESCYNPNLGTGKKTLPAPAAPTYQQEHHDKPPSLSLTPPDDHPRQPQAVARSHGQPRATTQPLPSPSHEAPSTRPTSWRKQNALLRSQKAAQAERKQQIARTQPASELAQTTQPRQATPVHPSSPADKTALGIAHQDFLAQGGQQVRFRHQAGQWQAWVIERIGVFSRIAVLPVVCERHGDIEAALRALQAKPAQYVQRRLHVITPRQVPYVSQLVYLGALGLRGGMDRAGGPSGSGEPQDELPAERSVSTGQRQLVRSASIDLQARMAQEDITSTAALIEALNAAQTPEEQQALQEWVRAYITWFNGQDVGNLTQRAGMALQEYRLLADIRPGEDAEKKLLLRDYFDSLHRKMQADGLVNTSLIEALEYTLQTIDIAVFDGNPASLIRLGNDLLARLEPGNHGFIKETYPSHRSLLYALHQALVLIQQIAPRRLDPTQPDGLYSRFKAQIGAMAKNAQYYYPVRWHALLLEQILQLLEKPQEHLQDIRRRAGHFLKGMIYLYQSAPIPVVDLRTNLDDFLKGCKSLQTAFNRTGIPWGDWFLDITAHCVPLLSLDNPTLEQYEKFEDRFKELQNEATRLNAAGRTAFRFGMVQQLRKLVLDSPSASVRKASMKQLSILAESCKIPDRMSWLEDPAILEALLEGLAAIATHSQGAEKEPAAVALEILADVPQGSAESRALGGSAHHQATIKAWLGNYSTIDEKLNSLPTPAAAPALGSLFKTIHDRLSPAAPQDDPRPQLLPGASLNTLLPPPPVTFFVGRAKEQDTLKQALQATPAQPIIAPPITGPGGIGKTQLVLKLAKQQAAEVPYTHVFWIPAESPAKLQEAYLRIADDLRIYVDKKDLQQAVQTVRAHLKDKPCLYVFDDAPHIAALQDFLPLAQGHVLITSRNSSVGAWPTQPQPLQLRPFGEQEAWDLAQEFGYGQSPQDQAALHDLLEQVPCYPLTLAQLFSTLQADGFNTTDWLTALAHYTATAQEQELIELLEEELQPQIKAAYAQGMVYVLKTTLARLAQEEQGEKARDQLLSPLAYLDPKGIPQDWLLTWDTADTSPLKRETRAALALLEKYSLIQWDRPAQQIYIHAETQQMVRHLHPQPTPETLINSLIAYVGDSDKAHQNPAQWASLLVHGRKLFERLATAQYPQAAYDLARYLGKACEVACLFQESLRWARECLAIAQARYPDQDHADMAQALHNVGYSLGSLGRHQEALDHYQQALAMRQRLYPDQDHADIAQSLYRIGNSLWKLPKPEEALGYSTQALAMCQRLYPDQDHPHMAHALSSMGGSLWSLGKHEEALGYFKQALAMRQHLYQDQDHPDMAQALNALGVSLAELHKDKEALDHYQQALAMWQRLYPDQDHKDLAQSLNNAGSSLGSLGNEQEALGYDKQALAMRQRLYPDQDHADIAQSLNNVGKSLGSLGRHQEGLDHYQQALAMRQRLYPDQDHKDLAQSLNSVGVSLGSLGRHQEGLDYDKQALAMRQRLYKDQDHTDLAHSLYNVGVSLEISCKHEEALGYYQQALAMRQRLYKDQDHEDLALSFDSLGKSLWDLGQYQEALGYYQQALEMQQRLYPGQDHADIARSLSDVGKSLGELGQYQEALGYIKQALDMRQRLYPEQDHADMVTYLKNIGACLYALDKPEEALGYLKQALCMALRVYQQDHPRITEHLNDLIIILRALSDPVLLQETQAEVLPLCIQWLGADHALTQRLQNLSL